MSSTDLDPNISINALTVSPDAVDEVAAALAQEQPRADKVAAEAFLSDLAPDATTWTFQTFDDNADRKAGHLARTLNGSLDEHWDALCSASDAGAGGREKRHIGNKTLTFASVHRNIRPVKHSHQLTNSKG